MSCIRILFVADSHLGFDMPERPRIERRRRGFDFLANHETALDAALREDVDLVVHGGDVFDRPDVPPSLAYQAYAPLLRIAERGVPVFVVPGNHERSRLPHLRLARHPRLHVFDRPRTFAVRARGATIALSGFPYERRNVRTSFPQILERTGWREPVGGVRPDARLLVLHHCVEGATVGPADFTFTTAADVIRVRDVPADFSAVLSGHIHRRQAIVTDLRGRPIDVPVLYPGSIERTALAEIGEPKGFMMLRIDPSTGRITWEFRDLPARPMIVEDIDAAASRSSVSRASDRVDASRRMRSLPAGGDSLESRIRAVIDAAPPDAVLRIRIRGALSDRDLRALSASRLRAYAPPTMNLEVSADALADLRRRGARGRTPQAPGDAARAGRAAAGKAAASADRTAERAAQRPRSEPLQLEL